MSIVSNIIEVTVTQPQPSYGAKFCAQNLQSGDMAVVAVNGTSYDIATGGCIDLSNLSGSVSWVAYNSDNGATPSPTSGTITGSTTVNITYTYPSSPLAVTISASPTSGTVPLTVSFSASASGGTPPYAPYEWNFGDGNNATTSSSTTTHSYTAAGSYQAFVVVSDSNSVTAQSSSITITVNPSGQNVSSVSVCSSSVQNGDYAIVSDQADTGLSGQFTIINTTLMQQDASSGGECSATVAQFIASHPFGNGTYWSTP